MIESLSNFIYIALVSCPSLEQFALSKFSKTQRIVIKSDLKSNSSILRDRKDKPKSHGNTLRKQHVRNRSELQSM